MRKLAKWIGIVIGVLLIVVVIASMVLYLVGRNNLNKTYDDITVESLTLPEAGSADYDAALARGEHLMFAVTLCAECHGDDLGGKNFMDSAAFGTGDAPNLTSGQGGIGASYTTEDWIRAVRHGVRPNGEALKFMPADKYNMLSDDDLAAIITYARSVAPVDQATSAVKLGPAGTIIAGVMMDMPAEKIDHEASRPALPEEGVTIGYGNYLVTIAGCQDCHGDDLDGKVPPGAPKGPNLTPSGDLGTWTEADFVNTLRTGVTPDGDTLDPDEMPWDYYTRMTDNELSAVWAYLSSLN